MIKIKKLSNNTINKIAAGEVVERPSSVIKELVENSIDASATEVNISLEAAGKNLIIISDDGIGMSEDEIKMAIQRHTTSKLDESDIMNIHSFGFRGEALPSIASISRFIISSKNDDSETGFQLKVENGEIIEENKISMSRGTRIEVRDIFYSIPARLKFLKADKTELANSSDIVKKIALAHPHIGFSLTSEGKTIFKFRKNSSFEERIAEILGKEFIENSAKMDFSTENINITGYVSIPTYNKASAASQYLFVNNRPVKDKMISTAAKIAYQDYLSRDRFPILVIFMEIPPAYVDVNVHPAKSEVRFRNGSNIVSILSSAIKNSLRSESHKANSTLSNSLLSKAIIPIDENDKNKVENLKNNPHQLGEKEVRLPSSIFNNRDSDKNYAQDSSNNKNFDNFSSARIFSEKNIYSEYPSSNKEQIPNFNDKNIIQFQSQNTNSNIQQKFAQDFAPVARVEEVDFDNLNEKIQYPLGAALGQFHSNYVISQTEDGIVIIDQHAAHERLVYEKLKIQMQKMDIPTQRLIIPVIVEIFDKFKLDYFKEHKENLNKLGLIFSIFGDSNIAINEVPAFLGDFDVKKLVLDLCDHFEELGTHFALDNLIEHVTETYACHHSIRSGRKLNITEMNDLLREMEKTEFSGQCNHGRPTYVKLKLSDIESLFGRK